MSEQLANKSKTTLNGSINNSVTSLTVTSATGFPTSGDFRILIKAEGANTDEILTVTAVSGTTFTVSRASEAIAGVQSASSHASGAELIHVLTAGAIRNLNIPTGFIGARALRTADQTGVVTSTDTRVAWNATDVFDTDNFHDPSVDNTKMIIPAGLGGKYLLTATVIWDATTNGIRQAWFFKNGGGLGGFVRDSGATYQAQNLAMVADLVAGDYVEVNVFQDSGSNRTLSASITAAMSFEITKQDAGRVGSGIGAAIYHNSNQTMSTSGEAALAMDSKLFDTDGFWSSGTNNRFTIPTGLGGKYEVSINAHVSTDPSGGYVIARKNGSSVILAPFFIYSSNLTGGSASGSNVVELAAGEYIEFKQLAASGATLTGGTTWAPFATIMRLDSKPATDLAQTYSSHSDTTQTSSTNTNGVETTINTFTTSSLTSGRYLIQIGYYQQNAAAGRTIMRAGPSGGSLTDVDNIGTHNQQYYHRMVGFYDLVASGAMDVKLVHSSEGTGGVTYGISGDARFGAHIDVVRVGSLS